MIRSFVKKQDGTLQIDVEQEAIPSILADDGNLLWIDLESPTEDEITLLEKRFDFHPLTLEDCVTSHSYPKIDEYDNYLFMVIHSTYYYRDKREEDALSIRELGIFVGENYVVTVHDRHIRGISSNRIRCERSDKIMRRGADFLFHAIVSTMVNNYGPITEEITDRLEDLEGDILSSPTPAVMARILAIKRNIITLRKVISPQRAILNQLAYEEYPLVGKAAKAYFRELHHDLARIHDTVESCRDMAQSDLDVYHSAVSFKLNEAMKTLTIIATIMMPLTLIAGIYGMNFDPRVSPLNMPEIKWAYGYPTALALMAVVALGMIVYFRRRKWL